MYSLQNFRQTQNKQVILEVFEVEISFSLLLTFLSLINSNIKSVYTIYK